MTDTQQHSCIEVKVSSLCRCRSFIHYISTAIKPHHVPSHSKHILSNTFYFFYFYFRFAWISFEQNTISLFRFVFLLFCLFFSLSHFCTVFVHAMYNIMFLFGVVTQYVFHLLIDLLSICERWNSLTFSQLRIKQNSKKIFLPLGVCMFNRCQKLPIFFTFFRTCPLIDEIWKTSSRIKLTFKV